MGVGTRNGTRTKTVLTDNVGPVHRDVPRDPDGTPGPGDLEEAAEAARRRRHDRVVVGREESDHRGSLGALRGDLGASLSKDTISRTTGRVVTEMAEWMARPLEKVYAAVFIDAIYVKVRDGQVPGPRADPSPCASTAACIIGGGRTHVIVLVHDLHVRVIDAVTGELLRELTIDAFRDPAHNWLRLVRHVGLEPEVRRPRPLLRLRGDGPGTDQDSADRSLAESEYELDGCGGVAFGEEVGRRLRLQGRVALGCRRPISLLIHPLLTPSRRAASH